MNDAHRVAADLADAARVFDASGVTVLEAAGLELKPNVGQAVRRDIGDQSMSGWRRGRPIEIDGRYDVRGDVLVITPERKAIGPMSVLSFGRKGYAAGDSRASGTYTSKRTGERKTKTRKVSRSLGATRGKGTWGDAELLLERDAPRAVERAVVKVARKAGLV